MISRPPLPEGWYKIIEGIFDYDTEVSTYTTCEIALKLNALSKEFCVGQPPAH